MKKLVLLLGIIAMFSACQGNKTADKKAKKDSLTDVDSLMKYDAANGVVQKHDFIATLAGPTPAGVINEIKIQKQEKATQGSYEWLRTYPKGNNGKDMTTREIGIVKDTTSVDTKDMKVWVLHMKESTDVAYFKVEDGKMTQLDPTMKLTSTSKKFVFKDKTAPPIAPKK